MTRDRHPIQHGLGIIFGINCVEIPGFEIHQCTGHWLLAQQGAKKFFVQTRHNAYRLFPMDKLGRCRTDKAITIPI